MKNTARNRFILFAAVVYVVLALAWIFLSDRLLAIFADMNSVVWLSTAKGIFFVLMTGILFFFAMRAVPAPGETRASSMLDTLSSTLLLERRTRWLAYAFAIVITLAMLLIREHIAMSVNNRPLLILLMLPITFSAMLGGLGPGLLATTLAALFINYRGIPPLNSFRIDSIQDLFQWCILIVNGLIVSLLSEWLRKSLNKSKIDRHLLDSIVAGSPDAIFIKDAAGYYLMANEAAAGFVGVAQTKIIGSNDFAFLPDATACDIVANDQAIMAAGQIMTIEENLTNRDGRHHVFLVTKGPVFDGGGKVAGLFGIARDITERKQYEEKILASSATLDAALGSMSDAVVISDTDGRFVHLNDAFATFHKFESKDECAMALRDYPQFLEVRAASGELLPVEQWAVSRALRGETASNAEFSLRRTDTGQAWVGSYNFAPIRNQDGAIVGAVVTGRDITEAKCAAEELHDYRSRLEKMVEARTHDLQNANKKLLATQFAMESVGTGIQWVDAASGRFLYVNKLAADMLGYTLDEMLALRLSDIDPVFAPDKFEQATTAFRQQQQVEFESVNRARDGRLIPVEVALHYLPAGEDDPAQFIVFVKDITRRKESEQALTQAMEAAAAANRSKSVFIANMSHEIRTPMNAILGLAYLLQRRTLPGDANELVHKIRMAGRSLLGIINDILDFSKIEAGKLDIEEMPFRLGDVLDNLATIMSTSAAGKDLELIIAPPPRETSHLRGDALRLEQVLINLTSNAVKFTDQGHVSMSVDIVAEDEKNVSLRFSICDTGIGIAPEQQQEIFAPFAQGDSSTSRRYGGTGLGLSISRRLVEAMGGQLHLASVPGSGSEFWFVLSFARARDVWLAAPRMAHLDVLIADDNPIARKALDGIVLGLGWRTSTVSSGEAAVRHVQMRQDRGQRREVLLLDYRMPGMDGLAAARAIRHEVKEANDPIIIMVTATSSNQLLEHPDINLADAILSKPVTASSLYNAVARAMRVRQGSDEQVPVQPEQRLAGLRIMVVDDSDFNRDVARQIFICDGAEVVSADNGQQALDWLQSHPEDIDIVLMDVQMPVMNGYEATRLIRRTPALAALPVIALTAGAFNEQQDLANEAGMTGFIAKPFDVDAAIALILKLTGRAGPRLPASAAARMLAGTDPDLPGLAVARALHIWKEPELYRQYLGKFAREYGEVATALSLPDRPAGAALAHKLKGAAGSLVLEQVAARAGEVERALQDGADAGDAIAALQAALELACASIARYTGNAVLPDAAPSRAPEPALLAPVCNRLLSAFDSDNPAQIKPVLDELAALLPAARVRALREALENFDFRAGEAALRALAQDLGIALQA